MPAATLAPRTQPSNEREADTHGMVAASAGGIVAGDTTVGSIVLPAGGPWIIHGLWGMAVPQTATAAEFIGGHIRLSPSSGDLTPDPAPSRFPVPALGSFLGATHDVMHVPLNVYPVTFEASGKAAVDLIYGQDIACTVAPLLLAGIMFGKTIPVPTRDTFMDRVRTTVTVNTDSSVGTVTLAEKATRITKIAGILSQDGVLVTGEELLGFFRLDSDDIKMSPSQYPFSACFGAGIGALIPNSLAQVPHFIDVNIPVVGGARIDAFVKLTTAVTNPANVAIYIGYE